MSGFRLARLLKLREDQAEGAKQHWAVAQRDVVEASAAIDAARARLTAARADLASSMDGRHESGHIGRVLGAHQALDSLEAAIEAHHQELHRRQAIAAERRRDYEEAARNVKALSRLEDRWKRERTARRRRADARTQDEFVARQARDAGRATEHRDEPSGADRHLPELHQELHQQAALTDGARTE